MSDGVTFQSATPATPPANTVVATDNIGGTHFQYAKMAFGADGTAYILGPGTPMPVGTLPGGTVVVFGTAQALGTFQPLAGSVHLASGLPGTVQALGTVVAYPGTTTAGTYLTVRLSDGQSFYAASGGGTQQVLGTVQTTGTVDVGTVAGTVQTLGTTQPLAGSVHLASRLPGTVDIGTIAGTVSVGTIAGTVSVGTVARVVGTVAVGTIAGTVAVGTVAGTISVGTVAGTVSIGTVAGTVSVLGTTQPLAGSVHIASALAGGTVSIAGSVWGGTFTVAGTPQVLGSVQPVGTTNIGTIQGTVQGSVGIVGTPQVLGTVQTLGTVPVTIAQPPFGSYFGTAFTAAVSNGTVIAPLGAGTRWRLMDVTVSASAAGTFLLTEASSGTTVFGPMFFAANGGYQTNSSLGYRARGTNLGLFASVSAGTMSVTVNYQLEVP